MGLVIGACLAGVRVGARKEKLPQKGRNILVVQSKDFGKWMQDSDSFGCIMSLVEYE